MELTITYYENNDPYVTETFTDFGDAIIFCEDQFGYEGEAWDLVIRTGDLEELHGFLVDDGVDAELNNH